MDDHEASRKEAEFVHNVYEAIASHFSVTRYKAIFVIVDGNCEWCSCVAAMASSREVFEIFAKRKRAW